MRYKQVTYGKHMFEYFENKDGCHICMSHRNIISSETTHLSTTTRSRHVMSHLKKIKPSDVIIKCPHNDKCINPEHLTITTRLKLNRKMFDNRKISQEMCEKIASEDLPTREIIEKYNVSRTIVRAIKTGKYGRKFDKKTINKTRWIKKLTQADKDKIVELLKEGKLTQDAISKMFGVDKAIITRIKKNTNYKFPKAQTKAQCKTVPAKTILLIKTLYKEGYSITDIAKKSKISAYLVKRELGIK